ncbi:NAD(P)-binding domain-containing protein [Streptomyces sp. 4.24]|uniref:NAD(P)-binding domain-containing protein n=1 Tax=Streptomyces tritrimontium TaxID=3406573 RepID=UPI003BB548E0
MRIAVLGTGEVGRQPAGKLVDLGHQVTLGSRTADNADAARWAGETGGAHGTFADAAARAELVVNATGGLVSLAAPEAAGAGNPRGKTIVDVFNALDFSEGFPKAVWSSPPGSPATTPPP